MALSGLDIYKLLPKTNCRQCGFATCLAFAMALAKKAVAIEKCPFLSAEAKSKLEESAQAPIKLITIGNGANKLDIGNETVMFRHEEKFHHPCGVGFIIEDNLSDSQIKERIEKINNLNFERVGEELKVNLVAVSQKTTAKRFVETVNAVADSTTLPLCLMSSDIAALKTCLQALKDKKPLLYRATKENFADMSQLAKEFSCPLAVFGQDLDSLSGLTREITGRGVSDLILETASDTITQKIWDLTQIRRLALKKSNRSLGFSAMVIVQQPDPHLEIMEAAGYISKYAGIVLLKGVEQWQVLALLTLRQNIYTDPQKPLQIEPKLYSIGQVTNKSPLLVTTNFSLSYYTVLGEVEASKVPSYILSVNTEGMSVLTAWAAEKFNAEYIASALDKTAAAEAVIHKRVIIPGYVAVLSGDLEEKSGWKVIVGPKEAAGIPSFLKNI